MKNTKKKYKNQMGFEFLLWSESETQENKEHLGELSHFPRLFFLTFSFAFVIKSVPRHFYFLLIFSCYFFII